MLYGRAAEPEPELPSRGRSDSPLCRGAGDLASAARRIADGLFAQSDRHAATGSGGNPLLNPYKDVQVDLSYEWYWHEESLLAVAPFYKHLDTFIGYAKTAQTIGGVDYAMFADQRQGRRHRPAWS
jgi:hypothetical protein